MYETLKARKERSRKLCRLLVGRLSEVCSPGLGEWDPAWERVELPSERFLDALSRWEETGREEDMDQAKARSLDLLEAWKGAERRFRQLREPVPSPSPLNAHSRR